LSDENGGQQTSGEQLNGSGVQACESSMGSGDCGLRIDIMSESRKAQRLDDAKAGGKKSAARRVAQAAKLATFRQYLERLTTDSDPLRQARIDMACSLYAVVLPRAFLTGGVNRKVNLLALSTAVTGLRSVLRDLAIASGRSSDHIDDQTTEDLNDLVSRYTGKGKGAATHASEDVTEGSTSNPQ
jgi:hypothetical protein